MDNRLLTILEECVRRDASDLHISSDSPAYARVAGDLVKVSAEVISATDAEAMVVSLLSPGQHDALGRQGTADVAFSLEGGRRFRGHVYREKSGLALAARRLEGTFRSLEELNLPASLAELAELRDGLVLFTGPTGSGKSTTLATLIDAINRTRACHILTIEDPIEYVHENQRGLVHQRELGRDVGSFAEAVRASLREDPDVVLVGEMRDPATMRAALTVAETGHLVFSTLHCGSAVGALDRILGAFSAEERESLCQQLSMTLRAVVAQHLLVRSDGRGRAPAVEILKISKAAAHLIRNHKSEQLYSAMENGGADGMLTLEKSLAALVAAGTIGIEEARTVTGNSRVLDQQIQASRPPRLSSNLQRRP
jgi:twitching motility protein PilT